MGKLKLYLFFGMEGVSQYVWFARRSCQFVKGQLLREKAGELVRTKVAALTKDPTRRAEESDAQNATFSTF